MMMTERLRNSLNTVSKWGKIAAIFTIITGPSLRSADCLVFLIGAVPGVLLIFSGIYLLKSASAAAQMNKELAEEPHELLMENYAKFIKWQVYYLVANVVLVLLGIILFMIFFFIGMAASLSETHYYYE
ncbi:DUF5362 family protein [Bacillus sonorensis]|nr:DUF5362 family protein [Bacillus sonorensis]